MHIKPLHAALCILLACGLLAACDLAAPAAPAGAVDTAVALTVQASKPQGGKPSAATATQPPTETPAPTDTPAAVATQPSAVAPTSTTAPTLPATVAPAQVLPQGTYMPYLANRCEVLRRAFEQAIGASVAIESAAFTDHVSGQAGTACRIHATGNGVTYGASGPFNTLHSLVLSLGWAEDNRYGAGGPTGMQDGYRKGGALGVLNVGWKPSPDVTCPKDQPIDACSLTPEQKLFDVTFDAVQPVVYVPLPGDQCASLQAALQPAVSVPLVAETVAFNDLEGNGGTACRVRGAGTGADFPNGLGSANDLGSVLTAQGWALVNGADGPTGTSREFTKGNETGVVSVTWKPSPEVTCPKDQPIESCPLTPQQRLFSLTAAFGQK